MSAFKMLTILILLAIRSSLVVAQVESGEHQQLYQESLTLWLSGDKTMALNRLEDAIRISIQIDELDQGAQMVLDFLSSHWNFENESLSPLLQSGLRLVSEHSIRDSLGANLLFLAGDYYQYSEQYDSADIFYDRALQAGAMLPDTTKAAIYYRWGHTQRRKGDYQKAINLIQEGIVYYLSAFGPVHTLVAAGYNNLAIYQRALGLHEESGENYGKALEIREKLFGTQSNEYARVLNNASTHFLQSGQMEESLKYALQTVKIFESLDQPDRRFQVASYNTLADVYSQLGDLENARVNFEKAVQLHQQYFPGNPRVRFYYLDLGRNAMSRQSYQEALTYFHLAMETIVTDIDPEDIWQDPLRTDPNNYRSLKSLASLKASAWKGLFEQQKDTSYLHQAIKLYELADFFATKNRTESSYQKSRVRFSQENLPVYEGCIDAYIQLHEINGSPLALQRAFLLAEKSKSLTLLEDLLEVNAMRGSDLPLHIQEKEKLLQDSLAAIRTRIISGPDSLRPHLDQTRIHIELEYDRFKSQLENEYSRYYASKYDFHFQSIPEIQENLEPDQVLLEYFVGEKQIFLFHITETVQEVYRIPRPDDLSRKIARLGIAIRGFDISKSMEDSLNAAEIDAYVENANSLYHLLLDSVTISSGTKCVIVPDGVLNYIPFGALLMSTPQTMHDFSSYPYLDRSLVISYNYSATLHRQMQSQESRGKGNLLGIAPTFDNQPGLSPLLFNEREVDEITQIFPSDKLVGTRASRDNFLKRYSKFDIFHFATHAQVDEENADHSFLAFSKTNSEDQHLYLADLYLRVLPAQLVTLSACQTHVGPLQDGEGVASLAKGFSYAGAKSIVTSLWDIEDQAAMEIMQSFYKNLEKGMKKDEALQSAKIYFLEERTGPFAHPYFWAAYIPIGDMSPIFVATDFNFRLMMLTIILSGLIALYFIRKNRIKQKNLRPPTLLR